MNKEYACELGIQQEDRKAFVEATLSLYSSPRSVTLHLQV